MRKFFLISGLLIFFAVGMNSCKKCYTCTNTTTEIVNDKDSTILLSTEVCSGKHGAGSSTNLNAAVADIESTGYTCTPK